LEFVGQKNILKVTKIALEAPNVRPVGGLEVVGELELIFVNQLFVAHLWADDVLLDEEASDAISEKLKALAPVNSAHIDGENQFVFRAHRR